MIDQICNTVLRGYAPWEVLAFFIVVALTVWVDLRAHHKDQSVSLKNAAVWSVVWVALSCVFAGFIAKQHGMDKASLFLSGYLLEKSLSVDNLFVFMAIFTSFTIKDGLQHRILYFGILGAIVLRLLFVTAGTSLLFLGQWVLGLFGLFVLYSAWQMFKSGGGDDDEIEDYTDHWSVRMAKNIFPVHPHRVGHNFFTIQNDKLHATPLFLCLVAIEISDVMFAFDSVPAVIAITQDPFLVYTSNIFAILGLRSMYFLLVAAKRYLCHLEKAVICILVFIGVKMLLTVSEAYHGIRITANLSLAVVMTCLLLGIAASLVFPEPEDEAEAAVDEKSM
jgi:tellurite resistance protein TerC